MENFRLRVFRTVARTLNFRAAAEQLFLTQPAVSQQIKALEEELGAPLFHRAAGRITLTPAGHALLPFGNLTLGLTCNSTVALLNAVEADLGVTFVSRWAVHNQLQHATLRLVRIRRLAITRSFSLARPADPEAHRPRRPLHPLSARTRRPALARLTSRSTEHG